MVLVQAFGAVEAGDLLAAGLEPADVRVLPDLRLCEDELGEDFLENGVVIALRKVDQLPCVLRLLLPLLDVQLGLHELRLFVTEKHAQLVLLALLPDRTDAESLHLFLVVLLGRVPGLALLYVFHRPGLIALRFVGASRVFVPVFGSDC